MLSKHFGKKKSIAAANLSMNDGVSSFIGNATKYAHIESAETLTTHLRLS